MGGKARKKHSLTVLGLINAQSIMHILFQLYGVLRFDSTVVILISECMLLFVFLLIVLLFSS